MVAKPHSPGHHIAGFLLFTKTPAELRQQLDKCLQRQADDVGDAPFDARHEHTRESLQSIAARFAERFIRREIPVEQRLDIIAEPHVRLRDPFQPPTRTNFGETNRCCRNVAAAGVQIVEPAPHNVSPGVVVWRLPEHSITPIGIGGDDRRIGCQDETRGFDRLKLREHIIVLLASDLLQSLSDVQPRRHPLETQLIGRTRRPDINRLRRNDHPQQFEPARRP